MYHDVSIYIIIYIIIYLYTIRDQGPKTVTSAASKGFFLPLRRAVGQERKPGEDFQNLAALDPKHFPKFSKTFWPCLQNLKISKR